MCIWSSFAFLGTLLLPSPYLFSPFSLYIYTYIYVYVCVIIYIYIHIHACMLGQSLSLSPMLLPRQGKQSPFLVSRMGLMGLREILSLCQWLIQKWVYYQILANEMWGGAFGESLGKFFSSILKESQWGLSFSATRWDKESRPSYYQQPFHCHERS